MSRILNILAMLSTAGWFAAAAGMGLAAAVVFGVVQNLDPALPGWENVDPSMTARLAAGLVTEPIFSLADTMQWILGTLLLIITAVQAWRCDLSRRCRWDWVRVIGISGASLFFLARMLLVSGPMKIELAAYRAAARNGQHETALSIVEGFNWWHYRAEDLWGLTTLCLIVVLMAMGAGARRVGAFTS